jgi:hypothetical protein
MDGFDLDSQGEPASRLEDWERDATGTLERTFEGLRPGVYRALVIPRGLEDLVQIDAGRSVLLELEIPPVTQVRILPVSSTGSSLQAEKLGGLVWRIMTDEAKEARASDPAYGFKESDEIGLDLVRGRAFLAKLESGAWMFEATPGQSVEVHFLGPQSLGAEPLSITLQSWPMEKSLVFSGL